MRKYVSLECEVRGWLRKHVEQSQGNKGISVSDIIGVLVYSTFAIALSLH